MVIVSTARHFGVHSTGMEMQDRQEESRPFAVLIEQIDLVEQSMEEEREKRASARRAPFSRPARICAQGAIFSIMPESW